MTRDPCALYVGLRRPRLEWSAELRAATELAYHVQVASDTDLRHIDLPSAQLIRFSWQPTGADTAATIQAALPAKPTVVTCWSDRYVVPTAHLAAAFGARGVGVPAAEVCTDKAAQRRVLAPTGLNPRWRTGTTLDELRSAVADIGEPALFKPAHTSGGLGVTRVDRNGDLSRLMAAAELNYIRSTAFVVEEHIDGSEHSVGGAVVNGEPAVWAVADKQVADTLRTTTTVVPSALGPDAHAAVVAAAGAAVQAVGIRDGGFHVDLRLGAAGPVILEVGARLGGDLINSHLVPIASGGTISPYHAILRLLGTGQAPPAATWCASAAMVLIPVADTPEVMVTRMLHHPGTVTAVDWPTAPRPAVAVVARATGASDMDALVADMRTWARADRP